MKILYIAPQAIPSQSANSIHMMKMAQAMGLNGHSVTLLAPKGQNVNNTDIYAHYGVQKSFALILKPKHQGHIGTMFYALNNANIAKQTKNDLVFSRCLISAWVCALAGQTTLFEIHDSPKSLNKIAQKIFYRLIQNKNCRGVVVISRALQNHLIAQHGIPADKIIIAPDGADPLPVIANPPFAKNGGFHAGYTGHLYKGRGIDVIAEAALQVPDITFHIVGGRNGDIKQWQNKLKSLKNIIFYGHRPPAEIPAFLQLFDVLLAPYQQKVAVAGNVGDTSAWMSPLKIFEYMSTGKPIICSNMPVLKEILRDKENALLCEPQSLEQWVEALKFLRDNPKQAEKIGETAKQDFLSHYTWQKRAENILGKFSQ